MSDFLIGMITGSIGTACLIHFVWTINKARQANYEEFKAEIEERKVEFDDRRKAFKN